MPSVSATSDEVTILTDDGVEIELQKLDQGWTLMKGNVQTLKAGPLASARQTVAQIAYEMDQCQVYGVDPDHGTLSNWRDSLLAALRKDEPE